MKRKMTSVPAGARLSAKERWRYLNFTDSFAFGCAMEMNPDIAKKIIEAVLPEMKISEIKFVEREYRQEISPLSKMTFLDVRAKLNTGEYVLFEMQIQNRNHFVKRTRYYRSECDVKILEPGNSYGKLNDVIQIIICCFDPFGKNRYMYDYEFRERETMNVLEGNGQRIIFLNAHGQKGSVSEELKSFLAYISGKEADGELVEMIDDTLNRLKYDLARETEYMKFEDYLADRMEDSREEGRIEGFEEGRKKERARALKKSYLLLIRAGMDREAAIADIAEEFGVSTDEIIRIIEE